MEIKGGKIQKIKKGKRTEPKKIGRKKKQEERREKNDEKEIKD